LIIVHRANEEILHFCNAENLPSLVSRGNATPEHVIRIKRKGVALRAPEPDKLDAFFNDVKVAVSAYIEDYKNYFERNNKRAGGALKMLDPVPCVFYIAGVGLFAVGKSLKAAEVAADIAEATINVITKAEGMDAFEPLNEEDLFDLEYWSLEQIKLSPQVAFVTGAAGGMG
ncbi:MAG: bifunctional aldolase/short-chain dehydrogenase, partial [Hyphomicrobiales bacterium]